MRRTKRVAAASAFSCAVYLTPLVGSHASLFLGEVIWSDLSGALGGSADHGLAWIGTDAGVALLAQLVLFLLANWFARRAGWLRCLCVALSVVPAVIVLNYAYMGLIPSCFLIEADTAIERDSWPIQCAARNVWIPQIASPPSVLGGVPIWVTEVNPPNRYGLLEPADCTVRSLPIAQSAADYVTYVSGRHALDMATTLQTGRRTWFVFETESGSKQPIGPTVPDEGQFPILSTDGCSVAWLRPAAGATPPIRLEAVIRRVGASDERIADLSALGRIGFVQLVQVDTKADELIVTRGLSNVFWIGFDGHVRRTLPQPERLEPQPQTYRFLADGWVAWDAYRDNKPYRVAWSLPTGKGNLRVPKGRSITSLAVSPDGRWIAVSVTSSISLGSTPDAVFVIRVADGAELFRKYLPKYTRSSVLFPDPGRFV